MSDRRPNNSLVPVPSENKDQENAAVPQPREPRNLPGLLAYSMQAIGPATGEETREFHPLSEENRRWLNEALSSMSVNVIEELTKAIQIVQASANLTQMDSPVECENALDAITSYVDNMDISNDFEKIGGFTIFSPLLNSPHPALRSKAANLIAEVTQNNEYCQARIGVILPKLLELVRADPVPEVRVKALYALSCSLRDYPPLLEHFMRLDGFSVLLCAMQSNVEKLKIKASFLLSSLCSQSNEVRDQVYTMGMVEQLAALLNEDGQPHEHLFSALLALIRGHAKSQDECRRPQFRLRNTIEKRMREAAKDDNLEQIEYCKELQQIVFCGGREDQDR